MELRAYLVYFTTSALCDSHFQSVSIAVMLPSERAQSILERLHEVELTADLPAGLVPFVREVDHLLSQTYQLVSELDCKSRTQPQDADARKEYRMFLAQSYPPIDAAYQKCLYRALAYFDDFPAEWKPAFVSELNHQPESLSDTQLKGEILDQASKYQSITADLFYPHADGSSGLTAQLSNPDRALREHAYLQLLEAERPTWQPLKELFSQLHAKRHRLAIQAGFVHYFDYHHSRPDYLARQIEPIELGRLRRDVLNIVRPVLVQIRERKARQLGVTELRPWDQQFTPKGKVITSTSNDVEALLDAVTEMLQRTSQPMLNAFNQLRQKGKFHVASPGEPTRAPYTFLLPEEKLAWMTVSYNASANSVFQVLHEIGHCLHYTLMPEDSLLAQRQPPREYREYAAHSLELLSLKHLDLFFRPEDISDAADMLLEKALRSIVSACILDEFQVEVYNRTVLLPEQINPIYEALLLKYPTGINLDGLLEVQGTDWASWQMFSAPFYGLEYALAWLAALTRDHQGNQNDPLRIYQQRFDRSLQEMFAASGSLLLPSTEQLEAVARQLSDQLIFA